MERMTSKEFVHTLVDIWNSSDRRICFVLGAGASKSSGIKTGGELATQWLEDIKARMNDNPDGFKTFLEENEIEEKYPGASYPEIYKERYKFDIDSGFDFINRELEKARPGYGYSVLAQILADRQHNIVITTNFDSLTEEALYTYSSKRPLICGHESLAVFAKPSVKRPLIVKIHRDRFLSPQSQPDEIERINELWVGALNNIFSASTPVFIGYGGNDGSLMEYMGKIAMINNMFWCVRKGSKISPPIETLLKKHNGNLVEIEGFDELMFSLQDGLKLKLLDTEIVEIAQVRSKEYKETVEKIRNKQAASPDKDVQKAAERIVDKAGDSWWSWELKAQSAKTNEEKEGVYREALRVMPESAELNGNFAIFLKNSLKSYDEAEKYYLKALSLDSEHASYNGNYALFLDDIRNKYDEAEKYYLKALSLNPGDALNNGNYALFLGVIRKKHDEAEKYYLKALSLDSEDANINANFAVFLNNIRKNYDEAEKYYFKALSLDTRNANNNENYALFLDNARKNYDEAEKYYLKALSTEPEDENYNANYAGFLFHRGKTKEATDYLEKGFNTVKHTTILAELWFYSYAHLEASRDKSLKELNILLCKQKIRSISFDLQENVNYAIKNNHPDPKLLQLIADIITKDVDASEFCTK